MTNARTTRRALLTSIMSLLLCCSMLMGTTFAWFTDTAVSTANRIVAGNLDVDLWMYDEVLSTYTSIADGEGDLFSQGTTANETSESLWEPGKTHIVYLAVANLGSLDLKYNIKLRIDGELKSALEYAILDGVKSGDLDPTIANWESIKALANGQTADFPSATIVDAAQNGKLLAKTEDYFALAVHMKETAGNEYQGKDVTIDIAVLATQLSNEEDSFGADYDQGAELPTYQFPARVTETISEDKVASVTVTDLNGFPVDVKRVRDDKEIVLSNLNSNDEAIPSEATLPEGTLLKNDATEVEMTVEKIAPPENIPVVEGVQEIVALNIDIPAISEHNTTVIPVKVEKVFSTNLDNVILYHDTTAMTRVATEPTDLATVAPDSFYYDKLTGDVILYVTHFSPFSFVYTNPTLADTEIEVSTPTNLQALLATGGKVTLNDNVTVDSTLVIPAGVTVELDLNGKTITGTTHKDIGAVIKNNGNLTISNGTITSAANNGGSALLNRAGATATVSNVTLNGAPNADGNWPAYTVNNIGELTLEDAKLTSYHGALCSYGIGAVATMYDCEIDMAGIPGFTNHAIYTYNNGKVIVNGGKYVNNAADQNATGGSVINGHVVVNDGAFTGRIETYYGTPVIFCGTFDKDPTKYAKGDVVANENGTWSVTLTKVSTADELVEALEAGKSVILQNNIKIDPANMSNAYGTTGINVKLGQTIDGNGYTLDIKGAGGTWDSGINTTGGLIRNLTVTGSFRGIFINHNSEHFEKVVLENVIIDGTTYTISCDQGKDQTFEATNCTFNGWTSYAATLGEAKFVDCKFGEGNGYAYCRPYVATEFVGCEFEAGYTMDPRANVTLEDCTLGGEALTADNLATLVTDTAKVTVK